ncbi:MAG: flagellar hook assembly protein FlgD [Burkholderiales bacterium]|jgi:flagellar basal-body rod modification protein FlgD|nr:flagellar hook assembly protein FlgD [Burkholderiales bacterium]
MASALDVINKTSAAAGSPGSSSTTTNTKKAEDPQDRFLKLLVTQMKNQDPLNPLDNAQVTSQIAQISTVSGIDKLNASITGMSSSMLAAQSLQASSMIGRGVLAEGNQMELTEAGAIAGLELSAPADKVVVTILGPAGETVESIDLGARDAGLSTFAWDGQPEGVAEQLPAGSYRFKVDAFNENGTKVTATSLGYGRVNSVSIDGGVTLNTASLGSIPVASVRQII